MSDFRKEAAALVNYISGERQRALSDAIVAIKAKMNLAGVLPSSMTVNAMYKAGTDEMRITAGLIWEKLFQLHRASHSTEKVDLWAIFREFFGNERGKIQELINATAAPIEAQLSNQAMFDRQLFPQACGELLGRYEVEAKIYLAGIEKGRGTTLFERLKNQLMDRGPFAVAAVVVAGIVAIAALAIAITGLINATRSLFS